MTDTTKRSKVRRIGGTVCLAISLMITTLPGATAALAAPVGQGFNLNASDLRFILKQIKIAEQHAATRTDANPCGTLLGPGPNQIPNTGNQTVELPWGLRTVDGSCNNIALDNQNKFGAADQPFPRLLPKRLQTADNVPAGFPGAGSPTSYTQTSGSVFDSDPRMISNLIVDQSPNNPAAVEAAGESPVLENGSFVIPNVAPDVGLSAPYNSWFTFFGQFFDHGLDLVNKGGNGTVFMPLQPDDPLVLGADGESGTADDLPPQLRFMVLTRATQTPNGETINQTSPFVDQSQTYTSHPSHQAFLREYEPNGDGKPIATGRLIIGPGGGMATWTDVRLQAKTLLGIDLSDRDALSVPLLATDPYGRFLRGPNGLPQMVTASGLVEGNLATPVAVPADAAKTGHAFLDDIAHHAVPGTWDDDANRATPAVPQVPDSDPGTEDDNDPSTYDDEMLGAHFMAGDGRVNENIALTAVHNIFHSEHNRLTGVIRTMIDTDPAFTAAERADWRSATGPAGWDYGEKIFQAARFVTEMEYQHLAFEEFARKVQPMVNIFGEGGEGYNTTINPAISAEFAHTVYRFGHSMLPETVARLSPTGVRQDINLLDAFLNPPSFFSNTTSADEATGSIVRGLTRQVGNEIDELVTGALRDQLLGLPLDLPALNLARGRDTGIPGLNAARRTFYAASNNSALVPYESWADFNFAIKHPGAGLVNFIAAYGTHPTVTSESTIDGRRAAAEALVYGGDGADGEPGTSDDIENVPIDREAFLNSTTYETIDDSDPDAPVTTVHEEWVSGSNGVTTTGVDEIDYWVGGLAEKQMVFGGLLGPTFNFVFESEMEDLQDGDRFYYLSRTAGLNLLTQLEGNSFAELIGRNSAASGLPADSFSYPAYVFNVAALGTSGPIPDDPETEYNEAQLLVRLANGTIRYTGPEHVVFNGTEANNRVWSSEGDDTIRGNDGDDWMQGGDGNDNLIGGLGDDILEDLNGDDTLKGGDGNDYMSSGQGLGGDLNQGGRGNDFIVGGNDITETFAGPGDDYVFAGDSQDTVFGDDGDDWIEGGGGAFNLLQGDNGAPFQDDPNEPGHDVLIGYGGEQDYDAEGGDDIGLLGPGTQRAEGMLGFDWVTHKSDPAPGNSDMAITVALPPTVLNDRDRFDRVEALSGWNLNDVLRGDSLLAADQGPENELTAAGIGRIAGLQALLGEGVTGFSGGNILIGGSGSDLIEGRGGDDLIDGDAWLNVRIIVRNAADTETLSSHDTLATLRAAVASGQIKPGQLRIVREIIVADGPDSDTALFSGPRAEYSVSRNDDGTITVDHNGGVDGVDTLRRIEALQFSDETLLVADIGTNSEPVGTLDLNDPTPTENQVQTATRNFVDADGINEATVAFSWESELTPGTWTPIAGAAAATFTPNDPQVGSPLRAVVTYQDGDDVTQVVRSAPTAAVANVNDAPVGASVVSDVTPTEGEALTSLTGAIVDEDGLVGVTFNHQWQQNGIGGGGGFANIAGATGPTFTPGQAQVNRRVRVVTTYTDNHGTAQTVTSAQTQVVGDLFVGTAGADTWTGTAGDDVASGGDGNDTLTAAGGNDIVAGNAGNDLINLGAGDDVARFTGPNDGADNVTGGTGTDALAATAASTDIGLTAIATMESATGGAFADVRITGDGANNTLNFGAMTLTAITQINGGGGNDTITGSAGADVIVGNGGDDTLNGNGGNDTFRVNGTTDGVDNVTGAGGTDTILAVAAGTTIGLSGIATVETVSGGALANVRIVGSGNPDTLNFNGVTLTGIVDIDGLGGADTLTGSAAADTMFGSAGTDTINGGGANDVITGGNGNDALNGQAGLNRFVYAAGFGADTITGFDANATGGQDTMDLRPLGITAATFGANVTIGADPAGGTRVTIGADTIRLAGVAPAAVNQSDFTLAP